MASLWITVVFTILAIVVIFPPDVSAKKIKCYIGNEKHREVSEKKYHFCRSVHDLQGKYKLEGSTSPKTMDLSLHHITHRCVLDTSKKQIEIVCSCYSRKCNNADNATDLLKEGLKYVEFTKGYDIDKTNQSEI